MLEAGLSGTKSVPTQKILLIKPHARLTTILGLQRFMLLEQHRRE